MARLKATTEPPEIKHVSNFVEQVIVGLNRNLFVLWRTLWVCLCRRISTNASKHHYLIDGGVMSPGGGLNMRLSASRYLENNDGKSRIVYNIRERLEK
jgi:hypothetical protein